jgi:predicted DNA-binding protein (MmcQ/YjbR family)
MQQRPPSGRGEVSIALQAHLEAMPGASGAPMTASRGSTPLVLIYKVMGKMFAILAVRGEDNVILKCDPHLAEVLKEQYAGVGHRSHLDRRFWISVDLNSDVPPEEIWRLATQSYALVCESLTRKQKADLIALVNKGADA